MNNKELELIIEKKQLRNLENSLLMFESEEKLVL